MKRQDFIGCLWSCRDAPFEIRVLCSMSIEKNPSQVSFSHRQAFLRQQTLKNAGAHMLSARVAGPFTFCRLETLFHYISRSPLTGIDRAPLLWARQPSKELESGANKMWSASSSVGDKTKYQ